MPVFPHLVTATRTTFRMGWTPFIDEYSASRRGREDGLPSTIEALDEDWDTH